MPSSRYYDAGRSLLADDLLDATFSVGTQARFHELYWRPGCLDARLSAISLHWASAQIISLYFIFQISATYTPIADTGHYQQPGRHASVCAYGPAAAYLKTYISRSSFYDARGARGANIWSHGPAMARGRAILAVSPATHDATMPSRQARPAQEEN